MASRGRRNNMPLLRSASLDPDQFPRVHRRHPLSRELNEPLSDEATPLVGPNNYYGATQPSSPGATGISGDTLFSRSRPLSRRRSQSGFFSNRLTGAFGVDRRPAFSKATSIAESKFSTLPEERLWYDHFTSIDWTRDAIDASFLHQALKERKGFRGRLASFFYATQGWIVAASTGFLFAAVAYVIVVVEFSLYDLKFGYCSTSWWKSNRGCCDGASICDAWRPWNQALNRTGRHGDIINFAFFMMFMIVFAMSSCFLTLATRTPIPRAVRKSRNLSISSNKSDPYDPDTETCAVQEPLRSYYSAAGSGVAEVRVILSGFILHGYLGIKTLIAKSIGLILSVSSGLTIGKEGPYVHISTCIGNIISRYFSKYNKNDGKRREVLSASAASGVAIAFGAPISGVLFSLEEVSYYFPAKTLFRTFFCCIVAALSLKFFNPYGTNKIVMFQVHYTSDWRFFELAVFVSLGMIGGLLGAMFIKASRIWARTFRGIKIIKNHPSLEVLLVTLVSGLASYWNRYTRLPVADLLYELASPCSTFEETTTGLCPQTELIPSVIGYLCLAFLVKAVLTTITFGIKVPAGIYVPSMIVGGLVGRIAGHTLQYFIMNHTTSNSFGTCVADGNPESCVIPGVYALVAAGATMCGVTRLSVTLVVILFELTGSLDYVLPFSIAVLVSKWTADALEPLSIYDLITETNDYPFLDQKYRPIMTGEVEEITPRSRGRRVIDISDSPVVAASILRRKLDYVHGYGELDGGLPIVRNGILTGLISGPDLEFALDRLDTEANTLCLMTSRPSSMVPVANADEQIEDLTTFVDESPIVLDIHSSMQLVYETFVKLGLRYICVLKDGLYYGMVHKKAFVKYLHDIKKHS